MKNLISIFMIITIIFSATGCRQTKQEIDHLSVVLAMGFDLTTDNKYLLTFQVLSDQKHISTKKMQPIEKQTPTDVLIYITEGTTPSEAIDKLSAEIGRNIFFGHAKYIVIGEKLAQSGLSFFTDVTLRGFESRPRNLLLVTKGKAEDIVKATTSSDSIPAAALEGIKKQQEFFGYAPIISRIEFANSLSQKTAAPIIGVIEMANKNADNIFRMAGTAVFKKDKLIGYLGENETLGLQWIKGNIQSGTISVPLYETGLITFNVLNSKSKVKAKIENDTLTIYITIKEEGNILEMSGAINVMKDPGAMHELAKLKSVAIKSKVKSAIYMAQKKYNADIFNFGELVHKTNPKYWKTIEGNWDEIFPNINVEVDVISKLKRPGIINEPIG
ncbi:MAG: Ger(x)C family spore germination protein [Clostridiaceae bacterium]